VNRRGIGAERQRLQRLKDGLDNLIPTLEVSMQAYALAAGPGEIHLPQAGVNRFAEVRIPVVAEFEPLRQQLEATFQGDADIHNGIQALRAVCAIANLAATLHGLVLRYQTHNAVHLADAQINTMIARYEIWLDRTEKSLPSWWRSLLRSVPAVGGSIVSALEWAEKNRFPTLVILILVLAVVDAYWPEWLGPIDAALKRIPLPALK
jgi:hypothetical protein